MDDDIPIVQEQPPRGRIPLPVEQGAPLLVKAGLYPFPDGQQLALALPTTEHKIVGERAEAPDVQQDNIAGLLIRGRLYCFPGPVYCVQP